MKSVATLSIVGWLAACVLSNTLWAADNKAVDGKVEQSRQTLDSIKQKIESLKQQLLNTQEAKADAADALKKSEKAISESKRKLFELAQEQTKHAQTLKQLAEKKSHLEAVIQQQKKQLAKQFYQEYTQRTPGTLQLLLQQEDPNQISRELQYYGYIAKARKLLIQDMQGNLHQVIALNTQTEQTLQQVTSLKNQQEQARQKLESEKQEKAKVLSSLSSKIATQRKEISRLKRDEQSLSDLVDRLSRASVAPKKTVPQESKSDTNAPSTPIARNENLPSAGSDGSSFAALKGKLYLPVKGEIMNRFGSSREDTGLTWKGLFIRASEGSEVRAIAQGKIVFADWMRGFGNLLIIDHGNGYMSLYGNNQALLRKSGDVVKSGDNIATVGNTGGNSSSGLYYELRQYSRPFDPLSWSVLR
jgi:murein hydrolase activator